jgi:predicted dehydrogenase
VVRWGIAGTGRIARDFADGLLQTPDAELVAVASRTPESARDFAERIAALAARAPGGTHRPAVRPGSYEELFADPAVDVVYVATPHSRHHGDTLAALAAGKHVLCEKPLALNAREAVEMVAAARAARRFLMEALWSRFLPPYRDLVAVLAAGAIGEPRVVEASFGFRARYRPEHRLFNPALGGGSILDLWLYCLNVARLAFGAHESLTAEAQLTPLGVDHTVHATLRYPGGGLAALSSATLTEMPCTARILGARGRIEIPRFMHHPESFTVVAHDGSARTHLHPEPGQGLRHQVPEVHRAIAAGQLESPIMPWAESVAFLATMDDLRRTIGVRYAADGPAEAGAEA